MESDGWWGEGGAGFPGWSKKGSQCFNRDLKGAREWDTNVLGQTQNEWSRWRQQ